MSSPLVLMYFKYDNMEFGTTNIKKEVGGNHSVAEVIMYITKRS